MLEQGSTTHAPPSEPRGILTQRDALDARGYKAIVEVGGPGFLSGIDRKTATQLWTSEEDPSEPLPENVREFNLGQLIALLRRARRGELDFVVVYPPTRHPPWHWRPLRSLFRRPFAPWRRLVRLFGIDALRLLPRSIPIYVVDLDDQRTIPRCNAFLLDRCTYYFKRELPIDRWQAFQRTLHPEMPSTRFRSLARNRRRIEKLRPWAIGYLTDGPELPPLDFPEKKIGLFVSLSSAASSTARQSGLAELRELAARRSGIFISEHRMPLQTFLETTRQSWLTWSPEGFGWDCIRHYEAAANYSVPVINGPTIERFRPLLEGVHALHYDADIPGSLTERVEKALADLDRIKRMAIAAREHVERHHLTPWRRAEQILFFHENRAADGNWQARQAASKRPDDVNA